jgi:FkbM family methyltransferase
MRSFGEKLLYTYARRFPVRRGKMRLVDALWPHVVAPDDTVRIARLQMGGFEMRCDIRQFLQRQFYFYGTYWLEENVLKSWCNFARNAKVILDVGANAGIFSLAALATQPQAIVHAFEPSPAIAERLRETARINQLNSLQVHELAVMRESGYALLNVWEGENGTNDGMNFVTDKAVSSVVMPITTISIDDFCEREGIDRLDCLKLDIQGNEAEALAGAKQLLSRRGVGVVFMELNWAPVGKEPCSATESIRFLEKADFLFAQPEASPSFRSAGEWMRGLTEVIAMRRQ